ADFDNDGDIDVLVTNNGQAPQLLRNDGGNRNNWLQLRLVGVRSNRDGIGARVKLTARGFTQVDEAKGGMSYQSAHDPRLHFGLGEATRVDSIEVRWPSGIVDRLKDVPADRVVTIKEGSRRQCPGPLPARHAGGFADTAACMAAVARNLCRVACVLTVLAAILRVAGNRAGTGGVSAFLRVFRHCSDLPVWLLQSESRSRADMVRSCTKISAALPRRGGETLGIPRQYPTPLTECTHDFHSAWRHRGCGLQFV